MPSFPSPFSPPLFLSLALSRPLSGSCACASARTHADASHVRQRHRGAQHHEHCIVHARADAMETQTAKQTETHAAAGAPHIYIYIYIIYATAPSRGATYLRWRTGIGRVCALADCRETHTRAAARAPLRNRRFPSAHRLVW